MQRSDLVFALTLAGLWVAQSVLIDPVGEFAMGDDWAYALPVKWLTEQGRLAFTNWQTIPLITHVLWGYLFCLPVGFSMTALRLANVTAGGLAVLALYFFSLRVSGDRRFAVLAALIFATNPLVVFLSHTFMSDLSFLALSLSAVLLLTLGFERDDLRYIAGGMVAALLATLCRQIGIAIPIAFSVAWPLRRAVTRRWLLVAVLPTCAIAAALVLYARIIGATVGLPLPYHAHLGSLRTALTDLVHLRLGVLKYPLVRLLDTLLYLGLFVLPAVPMLTSAALAKIRPTHRARVVVLVVAVGLAAATLSLTTGRLMPTLPDLIQDFGIGLRTLKGSVAGAPPALWAAVTVAAHVGAAFLLFILCHVVMAAFRNGSEEGIRRTRWLAVMLLTICLIFLGPVAWTYRAFLDRYLISVLPFILVLLHLGVRGGEARRFLSLQSGVAAILLLPLAWFSVGACHDALAWNRLRWEAAHRLTEELRAPRADVDGGFEYNYYYRHQKIAEARRLLFPLPDPIATYVIAFSEIDGYRRIQRLPCDPWLPWGVNEILVLERSDTSLESATSGGAPAAESAWPGARAAPRACASCAGPSTPPLDRSAGPPCDSRIPLPMKQHVQASIGDVPETVEDLR